MELIDVVYTILIYGGIVFFAVIAISFIISKMRGKRIPSVETMKPAALTDFNRQINSAYRIQNDATKINSISIQKEQLIYRKQSGNTTPQIFPINQFKTREIKIVRKQTYDFFPEMNRDRQEKSRTSGSRYTIVNEKKTIVEPNKVINYYP